LKTNEQEIFVVYYFAYLNKESKFIFVIPLYPSSELLEQNV